MKFFVYFFLPFITVKLCAQDIKLVYDFIPNKNEMYKESIYSNKDGLVISVRDSINMSKISKKRIDDDDNTEFSSTQDINLDESPISRKITLLKRGNFPILETGYLKGTKYQIEDNFPKIDWNTNYPETEKIGNYNCNKATALYRGTTLIAYYTKEIPLPIGPYKFGGLPGIIVLLYNDGINPNYWTLTNVEFPYIGFSTEEYTQKISILPKISLRNFIEQNDKIGEEYFKIFESKMPPGVQIETTNSYRNTVEQVYEWEKSTKK